MRAPRERSRTLVRLVPCVWTVAAVPPDTFCFAAVPLWRCPLLPCWLMPELPCWLPELPCCLAPVLEPDCMPESPNRPPLGRRQRELPRPRTSLRVLAFFSPEEGLPARQSGRGRWVSARSKNYG